MRLTHNATEMHKTPLHEGLVWARRPLSSRTQPIRRSKGVSLRKTRNDVTHRNGKLTLCLLIAQIWRHSKPEVHNISQNRQKRTEPRPQVKQVKVAPTRLPSVTFRSWSRFLAVSQARSYPRKFATLKRAATLSYIATKRQSVFLNE